MDICKEVCPCNQCDTEQDDCKLAKAYMKQIPKKPNNLTHKLLYEDGWRYECPTCKGAVGENVYHPEVTDNEVYCTSCGQALLIE